MPLTKKLFGLIVLFWLICFFIGYKFSPQINSLVANKKSIEATVAVKANSGTGDESNPFIQSINPTELEALMLETYTSDSVNPLLISSTERDYYTCEKFDPNEKHEISDPDNLLAFVNKWYKINFDYTPSDLVLLSDYGIRTNGTIYARKEAADQFKQVYDALKSNGLTVVVSSAWRSFTRQQSVLNSWINMVGAKNANNYAALPGYSEHHLGTAIDILTPENGYSIAPNYFNTKVFKWMTDNAYKYGFVQSYPQGKVQITGYNPEGWHWRYVGIDVATEVHAEGITFTEYLFKLHNICL